VAADYQTVRLSLKAHPMQILRPVFTAQRILSCEETCALADGRWARTAGVVLVRQRPGNGKAIFITLEDETGITNALLWARVFERFRAEVMGARLLLIEGRVQKSKEGVTHLMGARVFNRSDELARLSEDHVPEIELTRADEIKHPQHPRGPKGTDAMFRHPRDVRILPKSRDFH
jgi:error-prone DNA polymerase